MASNVWRSRRSIQLSRAALSSRIGRPSSKRQSPLIASRECLMTIWLSSQLKVRLNSPSTSLSGGQTFLLSISSYPHNPFVSSLPRPPFPLPTPHPSNPPLGARAYYLRQIFHNNNDETCLLILAAHLPALSPSSVILIDDKVLPDAKPATGSVEYTAGLSLAMKAMFNALERREGQWRTLLADAGLEIREIRRYTDFGDSIIVAGRKA